MGTRRMRDDDTGATLVIVLIIITVFAAFTGVVLSEGDTSIRATTSMRDQAGAAYNADGAAQVAINNLRKGVGYASPAAFGNVTNTSCFGPDTRSSGLTLPNLYPATGGQDGSATNSAYVTCTPETGTGAQGSPVLINDANRPGQALYTLRSLSFGQSASETDYVRGSVAAGTTLQVKGSLAVTGTGVTLTAGTCQNGAAITPTCTQPSRGVDPLLTPPARVTTLNPTPNCPTKDNGPEIFTEGTYTKTPTALKNCGHTVGWLYFTPGTYYFNYTGQWTLNTTAVGGTLDLGGDGTGQGGTTTSPAGDAAAPTVPNACVNPLQSPTASGVAFVFGGTSGIDFDHNSHAEFCASYSRTSISTAAYGLRTASGTVPALSSCNVVTSCAMLRADNGSGAEFYFEGFVYAPTAYITVDANNVTQPFFDFGMVANDLFLGANPSNKCNQCAFVNLPDNSAGFGTTTTVVNLSIYTCPAATCSSSGSLKLKVRVLLYDPSGSPTSYQRQVKVLSWSRQGQ